MKLPSCLSIVCDSVLPISLMSLGNKCLKINIEPATIIKTWASSRQSLSSGVPTNEDSNQPAQLQALART